VTDPSQALLQFVGLQGSTFPANSRYQSVETATLATADGRTAVYLRRRFIPSADQFTLLQEYSVVQGDRLDNISARYLGDPVLFWRIADANNAMRPEDLTATIGSKLRITLPQGISGTTA
jgi:nucleoid-associated protein YgaU